MKGRSNDRTSFMGSTNNSESRSYASHMIHEMRKKNFFNNFSNQNMNRCIEVTYDKWNRFENFVKFASNKEKKEKLQQLDPPPIEQYVDGDTVYKIRGMGQGRPPRVTKRPLVSKKEVKMEHKDRVSKMKALYGIGANPNPIPNPLHDTPREEKKDKMPSGNVFDYQQNSKNAYAEETKYLKHKNEENKSSNNKPKPSNGKSLYSFYQNIIDKNTEGDSHKNQIGKLHHPKYKIEPNKELAPTLSATEVKESPTLAEKSSKFKNAGRDIVHNSPHDSLGKSQQLDADTPVQEKKLEEIIEENIEASQRESIQAEIISLKSPSPNIDKTSKIMEESDGLLEWALNLPEDMSGTLPPQAG
eukprot:CAMPEP_0197001352 /NCGR_PEP_ID=MMETSP1380-20130617/6069_1 /TAXON_ID=5936 /ORGANISM="Euplotes crassus, Strain CT5" /LENGTH=357 /DNA_ID=CAMNT_0042418981 /DNA_START=394 /DNA_END=1464 /DNA_ORIENTATION=-